MTMIRSPDVLLGALEDGQFIKDLQSEIRKTLEILDGLGQRGKAKGSVSMKLDFVVEDSILQIRAHVESKTPKPDRRQSLFFVTPDGEISTQHPKQIDMFAGPRDAAERFG